MSSDELHDHAGSRWTAHNTAGYESPVGLAADTVVLTVREHAVEVLLVQHPEVGLALAGGAWVHGRRPKDGRSNSRRRPGSRTSISSSSLPSRDRIATSVDGSPSIAYMALVPPDTTAKEPSADWHPAHAAPRLAFDHNQILAVALDRVAGKLWWSNVAVGILPGSFTLAEARGVYEAISGTVYDPSTFARDLRGTGSS